MEIKLVFISIIAALTGGCGLLPRDSEPASIPSDGVSGFSEASPIELCLGTARVVPVALAGAGAGVCVQKGASGATCVDDASCGGIERCICGRCVVEACEGVSSCGGGRVCRGKRCTAACSDDAACASGERCVAGGCARSCSSDAACSFGERCDALDGACSTKLCGGALSCAPSDTCELERVAGDVHEPSLATIDGAPVAFIEIRSGGAGVKGGIYRARVDAPERWTADPPEPVLSPRPDEASVGAPSVHARDGSPIQLYFEVDGGAFVARASSSDGGRAFERDALPVLTPAEAWEGGRVASPSVVEYNGNVYLFYEGGQRAGLGLARVDGGSASRLGEGPVAAPKAIEDPVLWRSITEVGSPDAVVVDGALRLYFAARGAEGGDAFSGDAPIPADINDSIGLLTTRDLASFEAYPTGPVFTRIANLRGYLGEREPAVVVSASGASITFLATDASGALQSGLARAVAR